MKKFKLTKNILKKIVNEIEIYDIHTHLFPWEHENYFLSGLDEILNYHYLTAEFLSASNFSPKKFFNLTKRKKDEKVWNYLFVQNTPVSEASRGVIKIMNFLKIKDYERKSYLEVLKKFSSKKYENKDILKKLKIKKVVMTNNPFDKKEWAIFNKKKWDRKIFKSSLRLDDLFLGKKKYSNKELTSLIQKSIKISNPVYFAISVDGKNIKKIFNSNYMKNIIFPILKKQSLPLMILIGVKRGVNKEFKQGGDAVGDEDCNYLELILKKNPKIKFLVTHLSDLSQYKLIVLSRKFSNLTLFGFWWFLNQKKMISNILDQKINLLGYNFIAQHSDARVYEQLIYKWINFKEILIDVLYEKYNFLQDDGYVLSRTQIIKDISKILNPNLYFIK